MLDGLLGRTGFSSKCKSLIKQTRTRIEVVRRKRNATQKFLRKDIADLLSNGLDSNAFSRTDGLIAELILTSCYEFVDHVCELVLKHLVLLEKLRECPEDCRESVASLMFAAARFSDLPELRDLRDILKQKYGNSLECYVNQKLVENITPKPPSIEKKVQLLQDIASEFAIRWDSWSFQERLTNSFTGQDQLQRCGTLYAAQSEVPTPPAKSKVPTPVDLSKAPTPPVKSKVPTPPAHFSKVPTPPANFSKVPTPPAEVSCQNKGRYIDGRHEIGRDHDISFQRRAQMAYIRDSEKGTLKDAVPVVSSSSVRRLEPVDSQHKHDWRRQDNMSESVLLNTSSQKLDPQPVNNGYNSKSPVNDVFCEDQKSMRKRHEDATSGLKSNFRGGIPPYSKPRKSKHKIGIDRPTDRPTEENDTLTFKPETNNNRSEMVSTNDVRADHQNGATASENGDEMGRFTEIYYKDVTSVETPKRRSHRRKHSRSASTPDDKVNGEDTFVRQVSTSRRKHESRKGLQMLVDDDDHHRKKDDEERMIDKLLLHYSKKPTLSDAGVSRKTNGANNDMGKRPHHKAVDAANVYDNDSSPMTSRSFSLPSRQVTEEKPVKVFTRAASFQQDTPAKHVHPKLPDYDDLAARFNALRAAKG